MRKTKVSVRFGVSWSVMKTSERIALRDKIFWYSGLSVALFIMQNKHHLHIKRIISRQSSLLSDLHISSATRALSLNRLPIFLLFSVKLSCSIKTTLSWLIQQGTSRFTFRTQLYNPLLGLGFCNSSCYYILVKLGGIIVIKYDKGKLNQSKEIKESWHVPDQARVLLKLEK